MDAKAEALARAKKAIVNLQRQMTERILKVAAEVDNLMEHLTPRETVHFLQAACGLSASDASTYCKFSTRLDGVGETLRASRTQFPLVKALVSADAETRKEALWKMRAGARVEVRDVAAIKIRLREEKLLPEQVLAQSRMRRVVAAAGRRASKAAAGLDGRMTAFIRLAEDCRSGMDRMEVESESLASERVKAEATTLLPLFEAAFGSSHRSVRDLVASSTSPEERRIGLVHHSLRKFAEGRFGRHGGYALDSSRAGARQTNIIECLRAVTSAPRSWIVRPWIKQHGPLVELPDRRLSFVELCAGSGGMALGLEAAGFEPAALVEIDKNAAATLRLNRPGWNVIQQDVRTVDFKPFRSQRIDLLVGGLPCQPYSEDGKGLGKDDPRDLLMQGARAVEEMRPWACMFENVAGLQHSKHADHLGAFLSALKKAGYVVDLFRMNTEDYGVAQERERLLIVGMRGESMSGFRMPPSFPQWRTNLGDAIGDLMAANGWEGAQEWSRARREQIVKKDGALLRGVLASTIVGRKGGSREKERLRWALKGLSIDGVADEAPTRADADAAGEGFLPRLTLRMRARLQGFPDSWQFVGGKDSAARQIGNAVPPVIAQAMGLAIHAALDEVVFDYARMLLRPHQAERVEAPRTAMEAPLLSPVGLVGEDRHPTVTFAEA
ncbi:DNA (cytosine-5)-methyltransferase 1 [Sinorhizobium fredii]|uniref:Cytosine-specific methyltransferase n=1 Tax=Sinorhizobium fredii (strain USDA 257) TaxID=1185652 RepID=I3X999_SINF2|nr:DNA (cytosine-5-)-methyltransferase [Sinorhizobium fredii]AFL52455.1 ngoMIVM: modification methylase NgoMIV [Sinorhizobium fredii USDA 257]